jgi:hypothetical protein
MLPNKVSVRGGKAHGTVHQHRVDQVLRRKIIWSENGNHASIYSTGATVEEADAKLMGALSELKLMPETSTKDAQ